MKKALFTGVLLAAGLMQANAQIGQGFHAGLTTGIYYNYMIDKGMSDSPAYDYKFSKAWRGAPIGLRAGYQWESGSGLMAELNYVKQGQDFDILDNKNAVVGEKKIEMSYIQVPLLFNMVAGEGKAKFNFYIGPAISFLQKGTETNTFTKTEVQFHNTVTALNGNTDALVDVNLQGLNGVVASSEDDTKPGFNNIAVGGMLGLGMNLYLTDDFFLSGTLRLNYQFTEVREEKDNADPNKPDKYVDVVTYQKAVADPNPTHKQLATTELRNMATGGFQFGIHYLFGQ